MQVLIEKALKIADSKYTVLIRGETGTGKELLARAIHNSGQRRFYPFIPVNCSTLPEALMESELFGYEKGAFSGADGRGKKGLFEMADKGTLFLDEFGEMPLNLQAKLLRVLQDGGIRRVGGAQVIPVNARIIVATNANLEEMVEQRLLRADLWYRINVTDAHDSAVARAPFGYHFTDPPFCTEICQRVSTAADTGQSLF
ncbi:acetoacetate metabolism regulatory protein AtoC [Citrobacter koseri]|uniref:Acetoacetate metabolism regulatory protein AtoC n=1 Tax=Citrobacter koseri TaxID=545 RepID=A0A3S5DNX8_CITKO|nr:acetoacetate metabolism regulatory protein AtoC [Citrobacter koseri]